MKNIFLWLFVEFSIVTMINTLNAQWSQTNGPSTPGVYVYALAVSGANLVAGTNNGIYLSSDNGTIWSAVALESYFVYSFTQSGANLFAGTGGAGVYRSTNNGVDWNAAGLSPLNGYALAVSGANMWAGTSYGPYLSTDNGTNWTNNILSSTPINAIAVLGTNIFVGTYGVYVWRTTDNGTNWEMVNTGLTNSRPMALAVSGANLFAGTDGGGVFLSSNNGTSWSAVNSGLTDLFVNALAVSGANLYAGTYSGVFLSTNNGTSWSAVNSGLTTTDVRSFAITGTNIFAGTFGGGVFAANQSTLPVELTLFTASARETGVELQWKTATEVNNHGFEIEKQISNYQISKLQNSPWQTVGFIGGQGTTNIPQEYSFTDKNLSAGKYSYRLKQIDRDGKFEYSKEVEVTVGSAPLRFELAQNYPNPFNPETTIEFTVPQTGRATLIVFNAIGQEVATLYDREAEAGKYHQVKFNASDAAAGLYFSRLEFGGKIQIQKMLLIK